MEHFASVLRPRGQRPGADLTLTSPGEAEKARRFHSGLPGYAPTPLVSLDGLAHSLGVSKIWIKDESKRFGLNAFKALGGSYAMARCLSEKLGKPLEEMSFEELCEKLYEDMAGYSFLKKWIYRPGIEEVNSATRS